jgi:hypothetical protein
MNRSFVIAFRAAIDAVHSGDADVLARLLDAEPRLLHERLLESDTSEVSPWPTYFRNPKLLWFVANNPILVRPMPANMVEIANTMIARGVETADLEYTLELMMTGSAAREAGLQRALARRLRDAGAVATPHAMLAAAAHREIDILRMLVEDGTPMNAVLAAALGDVEALRAHLARADDRPSSRARRKPAPARYTLGRNAARLGDPRIENRGSGALGRDVEGQKSLAPQREYRRERAGHGNRFVSGILHLGSAGSYCI